MGQDAALTAPNTEVEHMLLSNGTSDFICITHFKYVISKNAPLISNDFSILESTGGE